MSVAHQYAKDSEGKLFSIKTLLEKNRGKKYYCIGCEQEMGVRMGEINAWHFYHLQPDKCNDETFLHKLAKQIFYNFYKESLEKSIPIKLEYDYLLTCNRYEIKYGFCCDWDCNETVFDLTKRFSKIELEKKEGEFIPDLKIIDTKGNFIFIEMAVTHKCEANKIKSGHRIIEFQIKDETDLSILTLPVISMHNVNINRYNFKVSEKKKELCKNGKCERYSDFFIITKSGKAAIINDNRYKILGSKEKYIFLKELIITNDSSFLYASRFRANIAHLAKRKPELKLKNCYLCRYHAINSNPWDDSAIFCKFLKNSGSSNKAINCNYFKRDESVYIDYLNDYFTDF